MSTTAVAVDLSTGSIRGGVDEGVARFLGIPYAAPPVGPLRFASPAAVEPWTGVRDATAFRATSPQKPYPDALARYLPSVIIPGDDWLTLSVWAPEAAVGAPVVVWVHGGSFQYGTHALSIYDGTAFARDGVVFVGINYRLGIEGFGLLEGAPHNRGLADVRAALEWVQREIAAFGGDPDRVTLMGESAGSMLVGALLAAPRARGLFAAAIMESGVPTAAADPVGAGITGRIARSLGIAPTASAFAAVPPDDLLDAQQRASAGASPLGGASGFGLAFDDDLVVGDPYTALQAGAGSDVPLIIGSTSEEYRLWFVPAGTLDHISPIVLRIAAFRAGVPGRVRRLYQRTMPGARPGEVLGTIAADLVLREPIDRVVAARAGRARTYVYDFDWSSPVGGLGACHALELGFVFDVLATPEAVAMAGADAPQALADRMHGAWVEFITTHDAGWAASDPGAAVRIFDEPDRGTGPAPDAQRRAALATRRSRR